MDLYTELGDNIALQYGGSEAHRKNLGNSGPGKPVRWSNSALFGNHAHLIREYIGFAIFYLVAALLESSPYFHETKVS